MKRLEGSEGFASVSDTGGCVPESSRILSFSRPTSDFSRDISIWRSLTLRLARFALMFAIIGNTSTKRIRRIPKNKMISM